MHKLLITALLTMAAASSAARVFLLLKRFAGMQDFYIRKPLSEQGHTPS